MTRVELAEHLEAGSFKPFTVVTHAGRFNVPHPDFIDIPPHEKDEPEPSYIIAYTRSGAVRFVILASIDHLEFDPLPKPNNRTPY
jgi:hypothetical protein